MREIRFREWDKEQAKMKKDFRFDEFNDVNDYFADNDFIFMQFTGLNDKNTDQNGQNRSKHSISVESMEMLGSKEGEPQKAIHIKLVARHSKAKTRSAKACHNIMTCRI